MTGLTFAFVTTFYPPYGFGGDAIHAQRLVHALADRGHRVRVVHARAAHELLSSDDDVGPVPDHPGVEVVACPSSAAQVAGTYLTGTPIGYTRELAQHLEGVDVVHFMNASLAGGPGAFRLGDGLTVYTTTEYWLLCPTHTLFRYGREVCTHRTYWRCSLSYHRPPQLWRSTGLMDRAVAEIDLLVAPSRFTAARHAERFPDARIAVVPPMGPVVRPATPRHTGHRPARFAYVGRLEPIKGVDRLVAAFREVRGAELVVAGTGSLAGQLQELADGHPDIHLLGSIPNEQVPRLLADSRAVVVPSSGYETFGISAIEAMSVGTPVVVRDLGPLPELVADGGGLTFGDDAELVEVLQSLTDDPARAAALGAEAQRTYERRFTDAVVVPSFLSAVAAAAEATGRHDLARRAGRAAREEVA